jgi:predicted Rossmann-fold nucleotide-binding protein
LLTLAQTEKLTKKIIIVLYGTSYWKEILNIDALVRYGMISEKDLDLFQYADDPETAMQLLQEGLTRLYLQPAAPLPEHEHETPAIAQSRV